MYSIQIIDNIKKRNEQILSLVDAETARKFRLLFKDTLAGGLLLLYYSGYRDLKEQQKLYNNYLQGIGGKAASPGNSWHNYKRAIDLVPITDTGATDFDTLYYPYINVLAKRQGLTWGGVGDSPHFVDKRGETIEQLRSKPPQIIATKKRGRNIAIVVISLLALFAGYKIAKL